MLLFALKNMAVKKAQMILILFSVVISAGVGVLAYNTAMQVEDGITGNAAYYSAIIGPSGSKTQLAMNTMYFTDSPLGTIPYKLVDDLRQDSRVVTVIPFAMADSYNGSSVVGTTSDFLSTKTVASGEMFSDSGVFEVVVGATVARINELSVGDTIFTSHAAGEEHKTPFTVVGILEESHTVYDNIVFTELQTIWEVHEEEEEHDHESEEEHEEHDHEEMDGMVCAFLIRTKNPAFAMTLVNDYNGKIYTDPETTESYSLQAIEPMDTVRGVLEEADTTKYIVFALCLIILVMNIMVISVITLLNMLNSKKEIALMRLIGIGMTKINLLYMIENGILGFVSVLCAFGFSRLCLGFMGDYVASMGVVLNPATVYPMEWVILAVIFAISVFPTVICTFTMSRKDGMED